jgi:UDP-glucose 4-epimerase
LISKLALSTLRREPINLFVPLSTVRDFIYTADLAAQVQSLIRYSTTDTDQEKLAIRIVSSQVGTSIGQILRTCQEVFHRRIPTAMGSHPSSTAQASDLRFISLYSHENDRATITPLPVGIKTVFDDVSRRLAQNSLIS